MIARARRLLLRWLAGLLVPVIRRWPRIVLRFGDVIGAVAHAWPFTAGSAQLRAVFPHLSRRDARRAMRQLWRSEGRNVLLLRAARLGEFGPLRALLGAIDGVGQLRPPSIIATFHVGAMVSIAAAVDNLPGGRDAITSSRVSAEGRVRAVYDAVQQLRRGQFVIIALDAAGGSSIEVSCLGRSLPLARGAFAIARIAAVPIVPMIMRWQGDQADAIVGEPITVETVEEEPVAAAALGRWLEEQLLRSPETIGAHLLRRLSRSDPSG